MIQPFWKTIWKFLKKLKLYISYNPVIPFLGYISKKNESMFTQRLVSESS